ncbi:hypothetical protein [Endozoicomonas sp. SESOKO1]|uniref:hypothetical protein n=1 Tax=Endozoicomonas sp. SESOKO1 TaxID=2828742 RepID=UPI002148BA98|nr:hypothetical protein [Endozoicomonas sp. SESOKO1]
MNFFNSLSSFNLDFSDLYPDSLDLVEPQCQFGAREQHPTYQGMSIQRLDTPSPVYHGESDTEYNDVYSFNLLREYNIASLAPADPVDAFGTAISELSQSVPDEDEDAPSHFGNEPVNCTTSSISNIQLTQQLCLSGIEPGLRESVPASHPHPNDQLTHLPVEGPQDSRQVAVAGLFNRDQIAIDHHTPTEEEISAVNILVARPHRKPRKNSSYLDHQKKYHRERYRNDPDYAECQKARQRMRYHNDPDYAERKKEQQRERRRKLREDPAYAELQKNKKVRQSKRTVDPAREHLKELRREQQREQRKNLQREQKKKLQKRERYRNDPDFAERQRERTRQQRKNPDFLERQRKRYQNDPDFAEHERERQRKRYQNDPAFAERRRECQRKRMRLRALHKDPAFAQGQKESCLNAPSSTQESMENPGELF